MGVVSIFWTLYAIVFVWARMYFDKKALEYWRSVKQQEEERCASADGDDSFVYASMYLSMGGNE